MTSTEPLNVTGSGSALKGWAPGLQGAGNNGRAGEANGTSLRCQQRGGPYHISSGTPTLVSVRTGDERWWQDRQAGPIRRFLPETRHLQLEAHTRRLVGLGHFQVELPQPDAWPAPASCWPRICGTTAAGELPPAGWLALHTQGWARRRPRAGGLWGVGGERSGRLQGLVPA